jgi:hypothetical protein
MPGPLTGIIAACLSGASSAPPAPHQAVVVEVPAACTCAAAADVEDARVCLIDGGQLRLKLLGLCGGSSSSSSTEPCASHEQLRCCSPASAMQALTTRMHLLLHAAAKYGVAPYGAVSLQQVNSHSGKQLRPCMHGPAVS